jgi:hypothetical protein
MSVTLFGSCRINGVNNNNDINNLVNYTHSTKEVLQQIKFLLNLIDIPHPFNRLCFRTAIRDNKSINIDDNLKKLFMDSTVCVIEICSEKKYVYGDFYLHHLSVDKRFPFHLADTPKEVLDNFKLIKQTPEEIENDILEIKQLLGHRKILFVSHYNPVVYGTFIPSRNNLINILTNVCGKYNITLIKPSDVLKDYKQEDVITADWGHYTPFGLSKISEYINTQI